MIYLDNSATTLWKPKEVSDEIINALKTLGNSDRGAHETTLIASRKIYNTREELARLFNIDNPLDIAFTSNATEALNIAVFGILNSGDHVITTVCEHNSVLRPLYQKQKENVEISFLPIDKLGNICYEKLEEYYKPNTKAIIVTHASNVVGNITDLKKISNFAKLHNLILIVDAAQTVGVLPIDVKKLGIDVLCFSGHKGLLGPQGTGGIYVNPKVKVRPLKVGGSGIESYSKNQPLSMPTLLEAGTLNGHGIAGLYGALQYLKNQGIEKLHQSEMKLADMFYESLKDISNLTFYGNYQTKNRVPIVSLNINNVDSQLVSDWLFEDYGICVRAGAHCAPLIHKALGTVLQGIVRFSFSHSNTEKEVELAIKAVKELAKQNEA